MQARTFWQWMKRVKRVCIWHLHDTPQASISTKPLLFSRLFALHMVASRLLLCSSLHLFIYYEKSCKYIIVVIVIIISHLYSAYYRKKRT